MLFGLSSPIIAVSVTTHQDNGSICVPKSNSVLFYGGLLPDIALFCVGLVFIFTSLWIVQKVSISNKISTHKEW